MIELFYETDFELKESQKWIDWIVKSMKNEGKNIKELNYIFCNDEYLLQINRQYLDHDYYTDVIGFDNSIGSDLMGDIFISVERIKDNSIQNNVSFENELARVVIHGILHFAGYMDKSTEDKILMTSKEDHYLSTFGLLNNS